MEKEEITSEQHKYSQAMAMMGCFPLCPFQVFVDLTRDAEEHDLEVASNGAVEQRPLQP